MTNKQDVWSQIVGFIVSAAVVCVLMGIPLLATGVHQRDHPDDRRQSALNRWNAANGAFQGTTRGLVNRTNGTVGGIAHMSGATVPVNFSIKNFDFGSLPQNVQGWALSTEARAITVNRDFESTHEIVLRYYDNTNAVTTSSMSLTIPKAYQERGVKCVNPAGGRDDPYCTEAEMRQLCPTRFFDKGDMLSNACRENSLCGKCTYILSQVCASITRKPVPAGAAAATAPVEWQLDQMNGCGYKDAFWTWGGEDSSVFKIRLQLRATNDPSVVLANVTENTGHLGLSAVEAVENAKKMIISGAVTLTVGSVVLIVILLGFLKSK